MVAARDLFLPAWNNTKSLAVTTKAYLLCFALILLVGVTEITLALETGHNNVIALSNIFIVYLVAVKKINRIGLYLFFSVQLFSYWIINNGTETFWAAPIANLINLEIFYTFLNRFRLSKPLSDNENPISRLDKNSNYAFQQILLKQFSRICCGWFLSCALASIAYGLLTQPAWPIVFVNASEYWLANTCAFVAFVIPIMSAVTQVGSQASGQRLNAFLIAGLLTAVFSVYCLWIFNSTAFPFIYILLPTCLLAIHAPIITLTSIIHTGFMATLLAAIGSFYFAINIAPQINSDLIHAMCITGFIPLFFAYMLAAFNKREAQMTKLSERMSLANKAVGLGVWEWCFSTRSVWWDQTMYTLYGLPQQAMSYTKWKARIHPEDVDQLERLLKTMARSKHEFTTCFRIQHPEYGIRYIQAAATVVYADDDTPLRFVGMNWDVTHVKAAEQAINLAKQKAEEASQIKGEFVANMSHEIRTPLNAALGAAQLLQHTQLSSQQKKYTQMIKNSGENLLAIVNDILDFSKIESGHAQLTTRIFNLKDTVQKIATILSPQAGAKELELILHIDKNVPTFVEGDELKLHQVLINLASNAIRFTHGGEVRIEIKAKRAGRSTTKLSFAVTDTGIGIAKNKQLNLFDAFTQVDSSSTRQYGGTGLGLTIAKRLVGLMGGDLQLESDEGMGSRFFFSLELPQIAQRNFSHPLENKPLRIFMLESNTKVIDATQNLTAHWPWDVIAATSVEHALNIFPTANALKPFDLIIIQSKTLLFENPLIFDQLTKLGLQESCLRIISDINHETSLQMDYSLKSVDGLLIKPITQINLLESIEDSKARRQGYHNPEQQELNLPVQCLAGITILLVEDNPLNQVVAKGLLEQFGASVDQAWNGREALEKISHSQNSYDLMLLDIQMPVMDGFSTCHALKERGFKLPIIAMTAGVLSSEREQCERAGMQGFVAKPIELHALLDEVQRCLALSDRPPIDIAQSAQVENTLFNPERLLSYIADPNQADSIIAGIQQLIEQAEPDLEELTAAVKALDYLTTAKLLHTQKGSWGNLGATPLYRQICSLETLTKQKRLTVYCRQWQAYCQLLKQTCKEAVHWLQSHQISPVPVETDENNQHLLHQLLTQLLEQSFQACDTYMRLRSSLIKSLSEAQKTQLELAINNFDFAGAAKIVGPLCTQMTN